MKWLLVLISVLTVGVAPAQDGPVPKLKPTLQGLLVLPTALNNPLFDRLTSPLGEFDLSGQFPLPSGVGLGAGASFMWWDLQERAFSLLRTVGESRRLTWYGKAFYAHYTGAVTFYELNARAGMSNWTWDCTTCGQIVQQSGFHWGASAGYFVHATKNLAFGLTLGYESDAASLDPSVIGQGSFPGYTERGSPYRFFTLGLGFSTRFEKTEETNW
jgi:hypothetical protein